MGFKPHVQLASAVGRDFERLVLPYFQLVFPELSRPTALRYWDQRGVDLMTSPERSPISVCVQCKSTGKPEFDDTDIAAFRAELDKFIAAQTDCEKYILALNRPDFEGRMDEALREHLKAAPMGPTIEIWDLKKIVDEAQNAVVKLIRNRIQEFNREWQNKLKGRFSPSGSLVRQVPAQTYRMMLNWDEEPELREKVRVKDVDVTKFLLDTKGPHMGLLIGDDGTGKTSAALIASQSEQRTVIYIPAASLDVSATSFGTSVLARHIAQAIDIHPPQDNAGQLFLFFLGRGLAGILRQDPDVTLIIDGLDENRALRGFQGLRLIRAQLKGMRCKTIVSTRTKHFNLRAGDFSQALTDKGKFGRHNKGIRVAELRPWTRDTIKRHIKDVGLSLSASRRQPLESLLALIDADKAENLYGTLLTHPIFLDLIIDDVLHDKIRKASRSSLVRSWILRKIKRDQSKYQGDPIGGDTTQEARIILRSLEQIAIEMSEAPSRIPLERIGHTRVLNVLKQSGLHENEIFELLLKSVLVATGQTTAFQDASIIFSHRIFHEYMIASAMQKIGEAPTSETPLEISAFYDELSLERSSTGASTVS